MDPRNNNAVDRPARMVVASVFDSKAKVYFQPFYARTRAEALRSFQQVINKPGHTFNEFPADFTLFVVGEWDENTGMFENFLSPESLGTALEHLAPALPESAQLDLVEAATTA